jgi:UDP-glucose 4-epimerase
MILLTGASGFIGKHVLTDLISKFGKEQILCFTSSPLNECKFLLHNNYNFEKNYFVKNGFSDIETIIHVGAFIPKSNGQANDIELCNSNINNTYKLISSELPRLKKVVFISTIDLYQSTDMINETTSELPMSIYGYSKLYCEKIIQEWGARNNKGVQILRVGHVYGPGEESYQKIIPLAIKQILKSEQIELWGTGDELRTFIYVKDVIKAIINSLELKENVGVINIVGGHAISINGLINKLIEISSSKVEIKRIRSDKPVRNLTFDNRKFKKYLLSEETLIEVGLQEEYEYFKNLGN